MHKDRQHPESAKAQELAELRAENERLKKQFDILSGLVILQEPELWEAYLEALKGK